MKRLLRKVADTLKIQENRKDKLSTNAKNWEDPKRVILAKEKTTYCIYASVGVDENVLYSTNCLMDTGAQPNSVT